MDVIVAANQIIGMRWCSPILRQKAWDYSMAANRRGLAEKSIAIVTMVLADVPEYLRDSLKQASAEEMAAKESFVTAWQDVSRPKESISLKERER